MKEGEGVRERERERETRKKDRKKIRNNTMDRLIQEREIHRNTSVGKKY